MKFTDYIEERILFILLNIVLMVFFSLVLLLFEHSGGILPVLLIWILIVTTYLVVDYRKIKKQNESLVKLIDNLDKKFLIGELIQKPKNLSNQAYYYALKKACKSMADEITKIKDERNDYQAYIESWIHEIKTPISALSLLSENEGNDKTKSEVTKIDNLVEQILFYARSKNTEKDYYVKEMYLNDIVHNSILNFKNVILTKKIALEVADLNDIVFTDEKWLVFIINQILTNSIKYMKNKDNKIKIYSKNGNDNVVLTIEDNGIGISEDELPRIFELGFTGSDRKKEYSTGMGLYICKNLCDRLGLKISAESKKNKYTKINIIFPKGKLHKFE